LPLTDSGKVARQQLPEPSSERPELRASFVAPRTPTEETIAKVWQDVLGLDAVGVHDAFLTLGGDSLKATQVASRLGAAFQADLPLHAFFEAETIAELATRHDLVVLADEIYGRILYDGTEHHSIASLPGMADRTIVLDGFSKTFAMTGWRLGYAIVPEWLVQTYGQLVINTISCAPTFAQVGAVEALRGPQDDVDAMVVEFRARRDLVVDGLNARSKAVPIRLTVPLDKVPPGRYDCQVVVIEPTGQKVAFWQAPIVIVP